MGKGLPGGRSRQAGLTIGPNQTGLSSQIDRGRAHACGARSARSAAQCPAPRMAEPGGAAASADGHGSEGVAAAGFACVRSLGYGGSEAGGGGDAEAAAEALLDGGAPPPAGDTTTAAGAAAAATPWSPAAVRPKTTLRTPQVARLCRALCATAAAGVVGSAANARLGSMVDDALQSLPWTGNHVEGPTAATVFAAVQSHGFLMGEYGNQFRAEVSGNVSNLLACRTYMYTCSTTVCRTVVPQV
jgi:hypothetical protein